MRQTLEAMLAANRRARVNYRIFWMSLPVFILPTVIGVFQLNEVGKATDRNIGQMLLLFGVALAASLGWNTLRFFKVLKPEQRRLEGLLKEYES
jgi:succinate-acetate transporter protein